MPTRRTGNHDRLKWWRHDRFGMFIHWGLYSAGGLDCWMMHDMGMTADDYVKAVHVFAEGNPRPDVASFYFSPACGEATCATRIRSVHCAPKESGEIIQ